MAADPKKTITDYLNNKNLSKKSFCLHCKISHQTLYNYLAGSPIRPSIARKMAKRTGIPYESLSDVLLKK